MHANQECWYTRRGNQGLMHMIWGWGREDWVSRQGRCWRLPPGPGSQGARRCWTCIVGMAMRHDLQHRVAPTLMHCICAHSVDAPSSTHIGQAIHPTWDGSVHLHSKDQPEGGLGSTIQRAQAFHVWVWVVMAWRRPSHGGVVPVSCKTPS